MEEKLEEAVSRVANEEISADVKVKNMIGIIEYPELFNYAIGVAFLCQLKSEKQEFKGSFQAEEIRAFKTIPDNMILEQKRFLDHYIYHTYLKDDKIEYETINGFWSEV